jgi:hypothetical protein
MTRFALVSTAVLLALCASAAAHAQMPTDNDAWKARCNALAATTDLGHLTAEARALTHSVPASKFTTFAFDRSAAGQPAVACTMFYLGAIAAQASSDASTAHDNAVLAGIEIKAAHHQDTTFSESLTRMKAKAYEIPKPALTVDDEEKVLLAATTIPYLTAMNESSASVGNHSQQPARVNR